MLAHSLVTRASSRFIKWCAQSTQVIPCPRFNETTEHQTLTLKGGTLRGRTLRRVPIRPVAQTKLVEGCSIKFDGDSPPE